MKAKVDSRLHPSHVWLTLAVGLLAVGACSSEDRFELTLRLHNGEGPAPSSCSNTLGEPGGTTRSDSDVICHYEIKEQVWSDGAGRSAVESEHSLTLLDANSDQDYGTTECGGRTLTDVWYSHQDPYGDDVPFALKIDDGSTIELVWQGSRWAWGYNDFCSVATGSWRGVAGDLDHRTGTYTMTNNSLQTVLHLVEE